MGHGPILFFSKLNRVHFPFSKVEPSKMAVAEVRGGSEEPLTSSDVSSAEFESCAPSEGTTEGTTEGIAEGGEYAHTSGSG